MWQNQRLLLVLPILFLFSSLSLYSNPTIPENSARKIIRFTLFNYDNIIADYYEPDRNEYQYQLLHLISQGTHSTPTSNLAFVFNDTMASEPNAVLFMLHINRQLKEKTGYYFVDN